MQVPTQVAFSQATRWPSLDDDRAPRLHPQRVEHAYSKEGGLRSCTGTSPDGCVVKTAGVDESIHVFEGNARVCTKARTRR